VPSTTPWQVTAMNKIDARKFVTQLAAEYAINEDDAGDLARRAGMDLSTGTESDVIGTAPQPTSNQRTT